MNKRYIRSGKGKASGSIDGAAVARDAVVKVYDKRDGQGVDRRMICEILFKAAFAELDALPDDACRSVAGRVHAGSYERFTEGPKPDSITSKTGADLAQLADMNTENFNQTGLTGKITRVHFN